MAIITKNPLKIVTIHPIENTRMFVQWDIDTTQTGTGPFTFALYRSGSPNGPYDQVASGLTTYAYEDRTPLLLGMTKDVYYYVKTEDGAYQSDFRSRINNMPLKKYLIWRKMVADERVMLLKGQGTILQVVKKRHFGERCSVCYDKRTGQVIKKNCPSCFGTSFEGGFFPAIETWGHIKPEIVGLDYTADTSIPEVYNPNAFLQAFPVVLRGDLLVEPETNRRYEVTSVRDTELLRVRVHQDMTISRLPTDHMYYKVAI